LSELPRSALFERAAQVHAANAQAAGRRDGVDLCSVSDDWGLTHLFHFVSLADNVYCVGCGLGSRKVLKEGESVPKIFEDPVVQRAPELLALCLPGEIPKSRLIILSTNSDAEMDTDWNYMRTSGAVIRRNQNAR
jgi:hypothetical protein